MRTQAEILAKIKVAEKGDMFGFEWNEYLPALTRESAETLKGTLLKDVDMSDWVQVFDSDDKVRAKCIDYMEFAWEKANGCRGISAGRSLMHYKAWLWLIGENGFDDVDEYTHYGKDNLVRICKFLDIDSKKWDDGRRVNSESE